MSEIVTLDNLMTGRMATVCETRTLSNILVYLDLIRENREFGVIVGQRGAGKTIAVNESCRRNPRTRLFTLPRTHRTPLGVLRLLCGDICGRRDGPAHTLFERLLRDLGEFGRDDDFLIIDEAQRLTVDAFEVLRDLSDQARVPIVLCGNEGLAACLDTRKNPDLAPLVDRVIKLTLNPDKTVARENIGADVDALFDHFNVRSREARDMLRRYALTHLSLRQVGKLMSYAQRIDGEGKPITFASLERAAELLDIQLKAPPRADTEGAIERRA
jgi:hypothetical protein